MTKIEAARRQLGTALQLYLDQRDPVSVHSLACAGCALADGLAAERGLTPFRVLSLAQQPGMKDRDYFEIRNRIWNALKHHKARDGGARDDGELLSTLTDGDNRDRLFVGWLDYGSAAGKLPIEAQVFNTWFLALDRSRFQQTEARAFLADLDQIFPGLAELPPDRQHQRLRRAVAAYRRDKALRADAQTDLRPLVLGPLA